ncbi:MAG: hypothetical protein ACP5SI_01660 [Chloroflexia bacterium]
MSWFAVDGLLLAAFATLYAGLYTVVTGRGYRGLLAAWLASLLGALLGYGIGHLLGLRVLWLGSFPWPEATLFSWLSLLVVYRLRM